MSRCCRSNDNCTFDNGTNNYGADDNCTNDNCTNDNCANDNCAHNDARFDNNVHGSDHNHCGFKSDINDCCGWK